MLATITLLVVGLIVLVGGADVLVRGAGSLSKKFGISPIVIGLTVVAFGTSAPELVVNVLSALDGSTGLALGNVVGSNISNILLVLGASALIVNLTVQRSTTWKEIPFAVLTMLVLLAVVSDITLDGALMNSITRIDGLVLFGFFVIFMYYTFELFRSGNADESDLDEVRVYSYLHSTLLTMGGLVGLFVGGKLLIENAVVLAGVLGMSEFMIGITVVAIGTSLPELATSLIAATKGQADIAIGNVIGSNIFNTVWILGATALIQPIPVSSGAHVDLFVCLAATIALFAVLFIGRKHTLERWQGTLFLCLYVSYIAFVVVRG